MFLETCKLSVLDRVPPIDAIGMLFLWLGLFPNIVSIFQTKRIAKEWHHSKYAIV